MAFKTKLDTSNNRQIKQTQQTITSYSGRTDFGLPFNLISSGANLSTSATTQVFENVESTFIGNLTGTTFTFGNSVMDGSEIYLNVITPVNSNDIQIVDPHFIGVSGYTNPYFGNTVYAYYTAVAYDLTVTNFVEYAPNEFSGTAISETVTTYNANSFDYSGDGIWVNVNGKLKTEKIIISDNADVGRVLVCLDSSGNTAWSNISTSGVTSGGDYFISGSSGNNSIKIKGVVSTDATGDFSFALGSQNQALGDHSFVFGLNNSVDSQYSLAFGVNNSVSGISNSYTFGSNNTINFENSFIVGNSNVSNDRYNFILGSGNVTNDDFNYILGDNNNISGMRNLIFGNGHILDNTLNSAIIGGDGITGTSNNTVYVPALNIRDINSGPSVVDIGVDANGYVVDVLSDVRLKEDILPIQNALDKILNLRGVTYKWVNKDSGGDKTRIGFIAQEVNEVVEELVFNSRDGKYLGVHYDNVAPLLVEAIKELVKNNEDNLITSKTVPTSSDDKEGELGDVVCDDNFIYIKTKTGWGRTALQKF